MSGKRHNTMDLSAIRKKLAAKTGVQYWRSLEELAATPEFLDYLHREFPENATEWNDERGRRNFLKLMGASLALAGLTSCSKPVEKIVPYVRQPEELVPGKPLYYATALTLCGLATGVLVESHMGRPTKIEGNPEHPASRGKSDAQMQAAILGLYDPDRSQVVTRGSRISTYSAFLAAVQTELGKQRLKRGAGMRFLTETVSSPTLAAQLRAILAEFPAARWHQWEPAGRHSARAGAMLAFGEYVETRYDLSKADVILSLDADFLTAGPGALIHARQFAERRRVRHDHTEMNRLYAIESVPTATGTMADHRLAARARDVEHLARAVAQRIGVNTAPGASAAALSNAKWIDAVARELQAHRGACVVIPGEEQSPAVHALAHAMSAALGNVGSTVFHTEPVEAQPVDQVASLRELVTDMKAGRVEFLVMLGGNPVYNAPADFGFLEALRDRVPVRAHLSLYQDETSHMCQWHVPAAHELESWSDARALDGTVTIQQPLIAPLYGGKTAHEMLAAFTQNPAQSSYDIVRNYWRGRREFAGSAAEFEKKWRRALHDGLVPGTEAAPKRVNVKPMPAAGDSGGDAQGVEVVFRPDPCVHDGRFANLGWLQELPKPLTKLVWDNAALVSPRTAQQLGVHSEDVVEVQSEGRKVQAAVWVLPGMADDSLALHLGYGRAHAGRVGSGVGVNSYAIRTATALWSASGAKVQRVGRTHRLVPTQHHHSIEAPKRRVDILVREGTLQEYKQNPHFVQEIAPDPSPALTLYPDFKYEGNAWGMAIDIGACNGCNACVVACQAENNIPVVGKDQVWRGREMHWIRIDRYYKGTNLDQPDVVNQPVVCMHCESAPCEVVCPVAATVHSDEGLNDMIYNRCVGTRYCSNNCPYKVRRFNFLQYSKWNEPSLALLHNPDVTVRSRGVMEKCTYCVQRINVARIEAEKEGRAIGDGEIQTACQQACPTDAIVFGNLNDKSSRVAKLKAESLNYGMLTELNTKPRTTYLARLRNPNPELGGAG
jgi:MoCo/4Fe-4S cofactor protein with predicted Tat translocation signal